MAVLPAAEMPCRSPQGSAARAMAVAAWIVRCGLALSGAAWCDAAARGSEPPRVEVATGDGAVALGRLEGIDAAGVRLADSPPGSGAAVLVPLDRVRSVRRTGAADAVTGAAGQLTVTLVDGSTLDGEDVAWDGTGPIVVERPEGRAELPAARVRSVAWRGDGAAAAAWSDAVPEGTESDLVVVGTAAGHEFVECAIAAVSADAVTVLLDDERIPVKRAKVIGLEWLRDPQGVEVRTGPGRLVVDLRGGRLHADRISWSATGLVVDGPVGGPEAGTAAAGALRLPADAFAGVDFAAGRRLSLAGVTPEKVEVEPWFGALARGEGLAAFFAPRTVRSAAPGRDDPPTLIVRPRTALVWRLPADGRRFRTVVLPAAGPQAADVAAMVVTADDNELFRGRIDASSALPAAAIGDAVGAVEDGRSADRGGVGVPIDVDVTGARRLAVTVDFVPGGGIGGAVRLVDPVIER